MLTKNQGTIFLFVCVVIACLLSQFWSHIFVSSDQVEQNITLKSADINTDFYTDLKEKYVHMTHTEGPEVAVRTLEKETLVNSEITALCHDVLHEIGRTAYENTKDFSLVKSDFCNSGYIHGLFESLFISGAGQLPDLQALCTTYASSSRKFDFWQCYHGTGHGLMYFTNGNLDQSLDLCNERVTEMHVRDCHNGVYMEFFNAEFLPKEIELRGVEDIFETCNSRDIAKQECYLYASSYMSQTLKMSYVDIFETCQSLNDPLYRNSCVRGVATEAMKRNMYAPTEVFILCSSLVDTHEQSICADALVRMYFNQKGSLETGSAFCAAIPDQYQNHCHSVIVDSEDFFR